MTAKDPAFHEAAHDSPALVVVDADRQARVAAESALARRFGADYRVLTADTAEGGLETLERLAHQGGKVALVAADLHLPGAGRHRVPPAGARAAPGCQPRAARRHGPLPLQASSGKRIRHRLNRGGDRQANTALWVIAMTRMSCDQRTKDYVARRTKEGKSKKDIIRCLKRYIAREVYRDLQTAIAT